MKKSSTLKAFLIIASVCFVLIIFALTFFWQTKTELHLDVSVFDGQFCALIFYAEYLNFFEEERLKIDYTFFDAGINTVDNLLANEADLATAAEFVAVNYIEDNLDLRILSTIATGDVNSIIYKKEIDLHSPDKKRIALKSESQADFFFQRYLVYNDLSVESFEVIDTAPSQMLEKLKDGEVDGVVVWDPFAYEIKMALKDEVKDESVQAGQELYFLLFSKTTIMEKKEEEIQRFLRAMLKAQVHSEKNEEVFRAFMKERFQMSEEELECTVEEVHFSISLSQALLHAMEAEARWCKMISVCKDLTIPNYLDFIEPKYLLKIDKDRVFFYQ